jgi:hypothetical protein
MSNNTSHRNNFYHPFRIMVLPNILNRISSNDVKRSHCLLILLIEVTIFHQNEAEAIMELLRHIRHWYHHNHARMLSTQQYYRIQEVHYSHRIDNVVA